MLVSAPCPLSRWMSLRLHFLSTGMLHFLLCGSSANLQHLHHVWICLQRLAQIPYGQVFCIQWGRIVQRIFSVRHESLRQEGGKKGHLLWGSSKHFSWRYPKVRLKHLESSLSMSPRSRIGEATNSSSCCGSAWRSIQRTPWASLTNTS